MTLRHCLTPIFDPGLSSPLFSQDLPYGTMSDNEMRKLDIGTLQDDGVIFVWVTGVASPNSPSLHRV
jgi:hypothetical protein